MAKVRKVSAGDYNVQSHIPEIKCASVTFFSTRDGAAFTGWIARFEDNYSDPVPTKREAVAIAKKWLDAAENDWRKRVMAQSRKVWARIDEITNGAS